MLLAPMMPIPSALEIASLRHTLGRGIGDGGGEVVRERLQNGAQSALGGLHYFCTDRMQLYYSMVAIVLQLCILPESPCCCTY
ncbi:hypothetical protein KC363_g55 [Hortaea werneckii]|nr:hypothetical protein KC363_g55 [Hortaea werneckii]